MEYFISDLLVWWQVKLDFYLPIVIFIAIMMSAAILLVYFIYFFICIGREIKAVSI